VTSSPSNGRQESGWDVLRDVIVEGARWVNEHQDELEALGMWSAVGLACHTTKLYAPLHPEGWRKIKEERDKGANRAILEKVIFSLYGPGGEAYEVLRDEILSADLLKDRRREAGEVLDSLDDGRNYVTICGALPLVEHTLAQAAGKWDQPRKYPLEDRLDQAGALTQDEENDVFMYAAAVEMLTWAVPKWWESRKPPNGLTDELNRQWVLHGTGAGWDSRENAIRAVMLVAAAARVAKPLLSPRTASR
jgi:hypothetical protein